VWITGNPVPDGSGQALHANALLHLIAKIDKSGFQRVGA
jgi:hypothetical protein